MSKILLVEDDESIIKNLTCLLEQEGYTVAYQTTQSGALNALTEDSYDLILLDITLPDGNGYVVCTAVKKLTATPVIFLTASGDEMNVVTGLDMGADDYIAKPFRPMELLSRIKNVLRRHGKDQAIFEFNGLKIDTIRGTATKDGKDLFLSALEYRLLLVFLNNKGRVLSRNVLLESIWDVAGEFINDNTLTVYIKRIREKIEEDPQNPTIIKTVRGLGYKVGD